MASIVVTTKPGTSRLFLRALFNHRRRRQDAVQSYSWIAWTVDAQTV